MKKKLSAETQMKKANYEHHSNLSLITTTVAMISGVVLLLIYRGESNYLMIDMAMSLATVIPVISWIAAAILAVKAVRTKKKWMAEYITYMIVMPFGLFFMYNMPDFAIKLLTKMGIVYSSRLVIKLEAIVTAIYFVVSLAWHIVLATPRKAKKNKKAAQEQAEQK